MKLTSLDKAVLLEKAIILNGVIATGNTIEKKKAKAEFEKLLPIFNYIINSNTNAEGCPFF